MNRRDLFRSLVGLAAGAAVAKTLPQEETIEVTCDFDKPIHRYPDGPYVAPSLVDGNMVLGPDDCLDLSVGHGPGRYMRIKDGVVEWSDDPSFLTIVASQNWRFRMADPCIVMTPEITQWLATCQQAVGGA